MQQSYQSPMLQFGSIHAFSKKQAKSPARNLSSEGMNVSNRNYKKRSQAPNKTKENVRTTPKAKSISPLHQFKSSSPVVIPEKSMGVSQSLFAGAKFNDAPSPKSLPKPPTHWMQSSSSSSWESDFSSSTSSSPVLSDRFSTELKTLLKVQS